MQIESKADQDPSEAADKAAALSEVGVDQVIFALCSPYRAERVAALARSRETITH